MDFLDQFIKDLLHLTDGKSNRLIDLGDLTCNTNSRANERTYLLSFPSQPAGAMMLNTIRERRGKSSNQTALEASAEVPSAVASVGAKWQWKDLNGVTSVTNLHKFIQGVYSELNLKGNNPLFVSVGAVRWNVLLSDKLVEVYSPLLIFPARLVRGSATSPVEIDFVDDDAYFNPCFINLLRDLYPNIAADFPHPNGPGADFDDALDLNILSDGQKYFQQVEEFFKNSVTGANGQENGFVLYKDAVAISVYNHSDICMYYDVRRNRDKIDSNPLIAKVFGLNGAKTAEKSAEQKKTEMKLVLPTDSVQNNLIRQVLDGQSLIVKGPPGTGKTLTIANMIAVLMAEGKRVMFASKKLSALTEVSNKLPENLRRFVMMLAYETERQASSFNTSAIRDDFRAILRHKRQFTRDTSLVSKLNLAKHNKAEATFNLLEYYAQVFGKTDFGGKSYYDALDTYFQYSELPTVNFADGKDIENLGGETLPYALSQMAEAGKYFEKIKGQGGVKRSPWQNARGSVDIEGGLYPAYSEICGILPAVLPALQNVNGVDLTKLPIGVIAALCGQQTFGVNDILKVLAVCDDSMRKNLAEALSKYGQKAQFANNAIKFDGETNAKDLLTIEADQNLTLAQLDKIVACKPLLYKDGKTTLNSVDVTKLVEAVDKIAKMQVEARENQLEAIAVFDKPLNDKQEKLVLKSYETLQNFTNGQKPNLKAKALFKKLATLSSNPLVSFTDVVKATWKYYEFYQCANQIAVSMRLVSTILRADVQQLDENTFEALALLVNNSRDLHWNIQQYFARAEIAHALLRGGNCVQILSDSVTVKDVLNAFDLHVASQRLTKVVNDCLDQAQVEIDCGDVPMLSQTLIAVFTLGQYPQVKQAEDKQQLVTALVHLDKQVVDKLNFVINKFEEVCQKYVANYYTVNPHALTAQDLQYFETQALDRAVAGAAIKYYQIAGDVCSMMPAAKLFEALEQGEVDVDSNMFAPLLEHSFLHIVINYRLTEMGNARNGLGHQGVANLEKYDAADKDVMRLNAKLIEQICLDKIDADDSDFAFLTGDKGAKMTMRGLFKTYANAVWKLKRCFILSPSTASVLFRPQIYNDFDVVIVDEASQLEPVYLLPILMRSKQCVLVGDEHQMPPITHFKAKNNKLIQDYDRELTIDKDISALSLALINQAFPTTELVCHYRSNTEALIAFSQRAFYPFMRTFPAAAPFGDGLGFVDAYVEDGRCEEGVNTAEANKTVELLKQHFNKYFDEDKGKLQQNASVGVVAFGEAQLEEILKLVERDDKLNTQIAKAKNAVDVPDKAVFFRTIESVQGQECDHLILSLTYGKDKQGKPQNRFGEMNRDDFGKCIFNVAVTRAKSSVTLVRSVEPYELDSNSRIGFIVEYMGLVKKFAAGYRQQFVSNKIAHGQHFVRDVKRYVESLGVEPQRIVVGYGVTDGSIRIPIAVLSRDLQQAALGLWCELPVDNKYNFWDYNLLYYNSLVSRNWNMHRIQIHEWFDNREAEQKILKNKILQIM